MIAPLRIKIVVFDMDGVLVRVDSCWLVLHRHFGADPLKVQENAGLWVSGKISYVEWMRRDVRLWERGGRLPHIDEVREGLRGCPYVKNARFTIQELKKRGYVTALVTCGLDVLAKRIQRDHGFDYVYSNSLVVGEDGFLTGDGIGRVDPLKKGEILRDLSQKLGLPLSRFAVIGDTKYDISMFDGIGLRIAFDPKHEELRQAADVIVERDDLAEILRFFP